MSIRFSDIEDAFLFVSSGPYGTNSALIDMNTGKTYYRSEMGGIDEIEENDKIDWDSVIEIP